jgi:hypothetical protein
MNDDPIDRIPSFDRVSVAAVLVREGEDATAALTEAGIIDPIVVEVMLDDGSGTDLSFFGDSVSGNLVAVLETEQADHRSDHREAKRVAHSDPPSSATPRNANLPRAFGSRPLAPVRGGGG